MGFLDKIKGAMNAVTGGGAKVTIEFPQTMVFPGDSIPVKLTATSTSGEIKSKGIFIDLEAREDIDLKKGEVPNLDSGVSKRHVTFEQAFQIAPAFVLGANETKLFEGRIQVPGSANPSYSGRSASHSWHVRGRVEALGNDPDSGYQALRVGLRS